MEANTGSKDTAHIEGNVPMELGTSSQGEASVGQQATPGIGEDAPMEPGTSSQQEESVGEEEKPGMGGTLPMLNPMAASFTPRIPTATDAGPTSPASDTPTVRPVNPRPSTPPSLERLARELRELKSSGQGNKQRLTVMHSQRHQLLSHMTSAKAEIDQLEGRLYREDSIQGSQEILNRLKELKELHEWAGYKWSDLGDEMEDLEAEIAVPGSTEDEFWGL